jgi:serine/threonine protein kinase
MSIDAELAALGEPAAAPHEHQLAEFLERELERLENGEELADTDLPIADGLRSDGRNLMTEILRLRSAAASIWDHSRVLFEETTEVLPDPFPGEFRIIGRLGCGAFGDVWLAEDLHLGRSVALKFLKVGGRHNPEQRLAALRNDARLLAAVRHPNVLQVYAWRQAAAGPCLVLQYAAGGSLKDRVCRDGPLPWHLATRYVADAADGLLAAHARGIVHRDVKPANLLWDSATDEALLTDFGIAARLGDAATPAGTAGFMAPEAFAGEVSPPLDTYSLAATLFWLTAGEIPFAAATVGELVEAINRGLAQPEPRCAGLPASLEDLVRAGLAFRAPDRPTLADFAAALRGALNRLLADTLTLAQPHSNYEVQLRLLVSRQVGPQSFVPVASSAPPAEFALRDFKRVPPAPERVRLHTGDRVRLEVQAARPGFVTVFNIGPSGNLNLLYPAQPPAGADRPLLAAHQPLHVLDVELTPPVGRERLFALWCRDPLPLRLEELATLTGITAGPVSQCYQATRDIVRVRRSWDQIPLRDRYVVVLEVDHV